MKKILLSVRSDNENFTERAQLFYININPSLIEQVKQLQQAVIDANAYSINQFNNFGIWSELSPDDENIDLDNDNAQCLTDELIDNLEKERACMINAKLNVTKDSFYFTACHKFITENLLTTVRININELDNNNPLIRVD